MDKQMDIINAWSRSFAVASYGLIVLALLLSEISWLAFRTPLKTDRMHHSIRGVKMTHTSRRCDKIGLPVVGLKCGHCGVKDNKNVVAYWGYCNESRSTLLIFSQLCLRIELHVFLTHRVGLSSFHDIHTQCDGCGHYSGHWRGSRDGRGSRTEGRLQLKISK